MYTIRPATPKDLNPIYEIEIASFIEAYPKSLLAQLLRDHFAIGLILELDTQIIGYAFGIIRPKKIGHIVSIAVDPQYRNRKFGSLLLEKLMFELQQKDVIAVELEVRVSNHIAVQMYKKYNFNINDLKRDYYNDGEDAYLMVRPLK